MNIKVKICGITNLRDAFEAVNAGADALGFICYKKSLRYIAPLKAREIVNKLPGRVFKVGVFVNGRQRSIKRIAGYCGFDTLQFHGSESVNFCKNFKGFRIIKAFRVKKQMDLKQVLKYKTFACLFDTFAKAKMGGTGRKFNWSLLDSLKGSKTRIFLSGGLSCENIREAIKEARPEWVDVSSSIEIVPGRKDAGKLREFIRITKKSAV